jgi:hypothetical protein
MINSNLDKDIRGTARNVREATDRFAHNARSEAEEMMDSSGQKMTELYEQASVWLQDNNRSVLFGAAILAVGVVGFFIGRSTKNSSGDISNQTF